MLICGECGARNDDGESFCSACEAYLGWQRPAAAEGKASPPGPRTVARPEPPPETVVLPQIPAPQKAKSSHSPRLQSPAGKRAAEGGTRLTKGAEVAGKVGTSAGHRTVPDSAAGTKPLDFPDGEPIPVKPGERVTRAPQLDRERGRPHPDAGPLLCATCGTGNQRDRSFCRRCAASLVPDTLAQPTPRLPWWKRMMRSPEQRALPAGSRPKSKSRRFPTKSAASLAVLGLLGGAASANSDSIGRAPERVADEFLQREVSPTGVTGSDPINDGYRASFAIDRHSNTSWATNLKGDEPAHLEATFPGSIRLVYVFITGLASEPTSSGAEQRPAKVLISVSREGANGAFQDFREVEVPQDTSRHGYFVGVDNVTAVKLTITAPRSIEAKTVSIAGVQFTTR